VVARADTVLSSALHGCVAGVAMGRKVLAVSGDRKIEAFMHAAGLGNWVIDASEVHRVPYRLRKLDAPPPAHDFIQRARRENAAVAKAVLALAGQTAGGP
jgi:hypothetical protein